MSKKYGDACSLPSVVVKIFVHAVFDVINAIYRILKGVGLDILLVTLGDTLHEACWPT